jgi:alkanesulfonate monooxygenase SsuD/methylene tetrahydromethanopterin reductase-like flavin-dependent oxidoreductase (luciferase family)
MKFGIQLNHEYSKDADLGVRVDQLIEMAHLARDCGYSYLFGMHHLLSSLATIQPFPLLSRLIPESGDMRLGVGVYLSNLEHPVHLAENWASLDQLSGGRVVFGCGAGYRRNEFDTLGLDRTRRWSRMSESIELLKQLWTGEPVTFEGQHFRVDGEACSLRPAQDPRPPIWIGANGEKTVRRCARLGDAWIAPPNVKANWVKGHLQYFLDELDQQGIGRDGRDYPLIREMYIGDSDEAVDREARDYIKAEYAEYSNPEYGEEVQLWKSMFDEFREKAFLFGTADGIADRITDFAAAGFNIFLFRISWGEMPFEQAMNNIARFADEVMPRFQEARV